MYENFLQHSERSNSGMRPRVSHFRDRITCGVERNYRIFVENIEDLIGVDIYGSSPYHFRFPVLSIKCGDSRVMTTAYLLSWKERHVSLIFR
uniref:C3H1-type domain-containing protein n=1 Tax=Parascaris univalens TaxID=6257 RepID=A0A915ABP4_PARUN